ncbi:hypothetical protein EZV62_000669 [Acer yangbiense]|uniref:Proteasome subunit beta n=1 Tax=Acer yangbiense TaxID=1000413 RepID=A0A5C7IRY6_9ROSI|nr:hypothetical protein EZV62_000669 [Acer yangbiense]
MECVFGLVGNGFSILVADTSAVHSILVHKSNEDKIMVLDSHKLIAASGESGDRVQFTEFIQKNVSLYQFRNGIPLTTAAAANFTRGELATALRKDRGNDDFIAVINRTVKDSIVEVVLLVGGGGDCRNCDRAIGSSSKGFLYIGRRVLLQCLGQVCQGHSSFQQPKLPCSLPYEIMPNGLRYITKTCDLDGQESYISHYICSSICSVWPYAYSSLHTLELQLLSPYMVNILMAGFDKETGPSLYYLDYIATLHKVDKAAFGYGSYFALSMMDRHFHSGMSVEEAVDLVDKCIIEIRSRLVVAPQNFVIKIVDKDGAREHAWRETVKQETTAPPSA